MLSVEFRGAAREVTGSCHVVRAAGATLLLDCGLFQGRRRESAEKNRALPVDPAEVTAVVLSHAHIDHAGRLPYLVARGYRGPVYATHATRDLSAVMLRDSAHIQRKDADFLARRGRAAADPLYDDAAVAQTMAQMVALPFGRAFAIAPDVTLTFHEAGHILGSAHVVLAAGWGGATRRLVFSGDIGRWGMPIIRDPQPPGGAHAVICESTYGDRDHGPAARDALARIVRETAAVGGRVLIPAFAVGRTQELLYELHGLMADGAIPRIPVVLDSPLAIHATAVFENHPDAYDTSEAKVRQLRELFDFPELTFTREVEDSKRMMRRAGPQVIIAASGMMESGRILHHLAHSAPDPRTTILIVSFQAEHTLGRRVLERDPVIRVYGEEVPLRARVEKLNGYSAHADRGELARWLDAVRADSPELGPVWLVHGEPAAQDAFGAALRERGYQVSAPAPGERGTV